MVFFVRAGCKVFCNKVASCKSDLRSYWQIRFQCPHHQSWRLEISILYESKENTLHVKNSHLMGRQAAQKIVLQYKLCTLYISIFIYIYMNFSVSCVIQSLSLEEKQMSVDHKMIHFN